MKVQKKPKENPDGTALTVVAAIVGVAAVAGVGYYLYTKSSGGSSSAPPPSSGSDGNPAGGSGTGVGSSGSTSTTCAEDSECPPCYRCITDTCVRQEPISITQTETLTQISQDINALVGVSWSGLTCYGNTFYNNGTQANGNTFTGAGTVTDYNGNGVPCVTVYLSSTNSQIGLFQSSVVTDGNGHFSFSFKMTTPSAAGVPCALGPTTGQVTGTINAQIGGTNIYIPFPVSIQINFTGV